MAVKVLVFAAVAIVAVTALVWWRASNRETTVEATHPPAGEFVEVLGTKIHIKIAGQGSDIVLIHGASGSIRDFTFDLVDRLQAHFRVIALDRPGHGWSERPPGYGGVFNIKDEPPELQAQLLQAATDRFDVTNPLVVGHSYGGAIALAWALERPQETAGLVLLAAASNHWEGELGLLYRLNSSLLGSAIAIPTITAFTPTRVIEKVIGEIFAPQHPPDGYMQHFGPDMTLRRRTMRANAQQVNALKPHVRDMAHHYPSLRLPVEIVHGTEDITVPIRTHSEPLERQIPGAVLTRLEGVGHMPHHTHPDVVVAAIMRVAARAGLR